MEPIICFTFICSSFISGAGYNKQNLKKRTDVCVDVALEAYYKEVDPTLAIAVAHVESGFRMSAKSTAGALGPMQIMPEFWCKDERCDLIEAGVRALKFYTKKHGTESGLCHYFSGKRCNSNNSSIRYRNKVLMNRNKVFKLKQQCIEGC